MLCCHACFPLPFLCPFFIHFGVLLDRTTHAPGHSPLSTLHPAVGFSLCVCGGGQVFVPSVFVTLLIQMCVFTLQLYVQQTAACNGQKACCEMCVRLVLQDISFILLLCLPPSPISQNASQQNDRRPTFTLTSPSWQTVSTPLSLHTGLSAHMFFHRDGAQGHRLLKVHPSSNIILIGQE